MNGVKEGLKTLLRQQIASSGPITFARYMDLCLYHPRYGYYMQPRILRGRDGDYFTSPTVGPLYGRTLARQIAEMAQFLHGEFHIVEVGSGEGHLAGDILAALREEASDVYRRLHYLSVEVNPFMLEAQRQRLKAFEGKISWPRWDEIGEVRGCILCNELLDALPVHRVRVEGGLKEIRVGLEGEGFCDVLVEPTPEVEGYFRWLGLFPPEGCEGEAGLSALEFLQGAAERLSEGFLFIIDYGHEAEVLLSERFPKGTVATYRRHRVGDDPYKDPGLQDITAHVNFTALLKRGRELGFTVLGPRPQGEFLIALGVLQGLEGLRERLQAKRLILPGGMGDVFKVLVLCKGVGSPVLQGFKEVW